MKRERMVPSPMKKFFAWLVPTERAVYAKLSKGNKYFLVVLYGTIIALVIGTLYMFGSQVRTRTYPVGGIQLTTPYSKYLVGEEITFTITNKYNSPIYVANNCPAEPLEVYKLVGGRWVRQHDKADQKDCHVEDRDIKVDAGKSASGSFKSWKKLFAEPGKYRLVAYVEYYNALPYRDIEVVKKPDVPAIPAVIPPSTRTVTSNGNTSTTTQKTSTSSNSSSGTGGSTSSGTTAATRQSKTISISAGTVKIEYTATTIYVISITPAAGYTYEGGGSGAQVEITFKKAGTETQLQLLIQNGQVVQRVESGG